MSQEPPPDEGTDAVPGEPGQRRVLDKIAAAPRLGDIVFDWTAGWHETGDRKLGYFRSESAVQADWAKRHSARSASAVATLYQVPETRTGREHLYEVNLEAMDRTSLPWTNWVINRLLGLCRIPEVARAQFELLPAGVACDGGYGYGCAPCMQRQFCAGPTHPWGSGRCDQAWLGHGGWCRIRFFDCYQSGSWANVNRTAISKDPRHPNEPRLICTLRLNCLVPHALCGRLL